MNGAELVHLTIELHFYKLKNYLAKCNAYEGSS